MNGFARRFAHHVRVANESSLQIDLNGVRSCADLESPAARRHCGRAHRFRCTWVCGTVLRSGVCGLRPDSSVIQHRSRKGRHRLRCGVPRGRVCRSSQREPGRCGALRHRGHARGRIAHWTITCEPLVSVPVNSACLPIDTIRCQCVSSASSPWRQRFGRQRRTEEGLNRWYAPPGRVMRQRSTSW
jgi:hypothetical protein